MRIPARARLRARSLALALAVPVVILLGLPARAAHAADVLPDLVGVAPTNPRFEVPTLGDGQKHFLVRFDAVLYNIGPGPLEVRGSNPANGVMTESWQRIYQTGSGYRSDYSRHPVIKYEVSDGHEHWHVQNAARYVLMNEAGTGEAGRGAKVGFCLEDVDQVEPSAPGDGYSAGATEYCKSGQPNTPSVFQGITPGWQDTYVSRLPFQWVDLSDIVPGRYRIGELADPDNIFIEENEGNNGPALASEVITVPGWLASPGTVTAGGGKTTILLGAQRFGEPGPATFRVESLPKHGDLSFIPGTPPHQLAYTPKRRFEGTDSFTFSARDSSSAFPLHTPVATVTVKVPGAATRARRARLLGKVRFSLRGRYLIVRARAKRTGTLKVRIRKRKRKLGACTKRARANRPFRCRIKLRRRTSPAGGRAVVTLIRKGKAAAVDTYRVPRRLRR